MFLKWGKCSFEVRILPMTAKNVPELSERYGNRTLCALAIVEVPLHHFWCMLTLSSLVERGQWCRNNGFFRNETGKGVISSDSSHFQYMQK